MIWYAHTDVIILDTSCNSWWRHMKTPGTEFTEGQTPRTKSTIPPFSFLDLCPRIRLTHVWKVSHSVWNATTNYATLYILKITAYQLGGNRAFSLTCVAVFYSRNTRNTITNVRKATITYKNIIHAILQSWYKWHSLQCWFNFSITVNSY